MGVLFFSVDETAFLINALKERKKEVEIDFVNFTRSDVAFFYDPVVSCIEKLISGGIDNLSKREIEIMKSCIADKEDLKINHSNSVEIEKIKNILDSIQSKID